MKTVYRIARDGAGPYRQLDYRNTWTTSSHDNEDRHPNIYGDIRLLDQNIHMYKNLKFGFISLESLMRWFALEELKKLDKLKFKLEIYEIDECFVGNKQVIFNAAKATKLEEKSLLSLVKEALKWLKLNTFGKKSWQITECDI